MPILRRIIDVPPSPAGVASAKSKLPAFYAAGAAALGLVAAWFYWGQGLTLSHYDAKGHLVVARRVIDSLTPGWQQIGAVWLPLPHLLNLLPVQLDAFYRTGASAVAISIVSVAIAAWSLSRLVLAMTGSAAAASTGVALLVLNPNILYLQATPMTEPLLLGLLLLATWRLYDWVVRPGARAAVPGLVLAAACWTRYEAWPFAAVALALAAWARWRRGERLRIALGRTGRIAAYPIAAILLFLVNSKVTVGAWFVTGGFYVPDPRLQGHPVTVTVAVWWGGRELGSDVLLGAAAASAIGLLAIALRGRPAAIVPLALAAVAALPWYAFFQGHPYRVRYMVPLVAAAAVLTALGTGLLPRRLRRLGAVVVLAGVLIQAPPFDPGAAMVLEAQWDRPNSRARAAVADCLAARYGGETVMASMGSLAHFMQELSHTGFDLQDFLHEGNGDLWLSAFRGRPDDAVGWVLIEERAEGGDMLAARARTDPRMLANFTRVCEGGGVALYRANWLAD